MCPDGGDDGSRYYGRSIALREFALLNPLTYANTELTVGAYSPYPTTQIVNLPGLCFERGAIALVCAIGIEVLAISLLCVAGKSGCACPISPICLERGSFTASRTATRSSACASAVAYVRTMGKLLLRSPTLAVCAIAMSTTMLAPALVEMFPDADNVSAVRYRDGELRSIDRYLEQNAANMDVEGKAALEDMRDALSGFVYAPMPAEGFEALRRTSALEVSWARQMRLSCNRLESSRRLLLVRRRAPFCLSRSRACRTPRFTS